mgnify:CR=1 FL=1
MIKLFEDMVNQPAVRVSMKNDSSTNLNTVVVEELAGPPTNEWTVVTNDSDEAAALNLTTHKLLKSLRLAATTIFLNDAKVGYKSSSEVLQTLLETVE